MRLPEVIEPKFRTGELLQAYLRGYLDTGRLNPWAEALLMEGVETDAVIYAAANDDLDREEVRRTFERLCAELGISEDLASEPEDVVRRVWLHEVALGVRSASETVARFDEVRKQIGLPGAVMFRLVPDRDGSNASGYRCPAAGLDGEQLEGEVRARLQKARLLS